MKPTHRRKDNIKMDFSDIVYDGRIHLDHLWALGHIEFTLRGIKSCRMFLL